MWLPNNLGKISILNKGEVNSQIKNKTHLVSTPPTPFTKSCQCPESHDLRKYRKQHFLVLN